MNRLTNSEENDFISPDLDEGWWSSVLADEPSIFLANKDINCKPCKSQNFEDLDWDCVKRVFAQDEVVLLEVTGFNRGGLLVQGEGIQGFVPVSHLIDFQIVLSDEEKHGKLKEYVGRSVYLKIIECDPINERIVLSERAAQAGEGKRNELFKSLSPGTTACGVVTNITDFGGFVDLGGVEGLIHVSELSWGRVDDPAQMLKIGQRVKVLVLQVNESSSRIALSLKRLTPNPWENLLENCHPGDVVQAEITSIMRFGVFARLEEGVEGLIHISSIPETTRNKEISLLYSPGQHIHVKILHLDAERRRLGLGLIPEDEC